MSSSSSASCSAMTRPRRPSSCSPSTTKARRWWPASRGRRRSGTCTGSTSTASRPPLPPRRFRRRGEVIRVELPPEELDVLRNLAGEMAGLLATGVPDEVRTRLFPPAYDDAMKEAEFRRLMASDLEERKAADLATLRISLDQEPPFELSSE